MRFLFRSFLLFCMFISNNYVKAQYNVTGVQTDFNGFWSSSSTAINAVKPNNSHNLLAFTWNGTTFSTGVNDAKLILNGVNFTAKDFRAFPITIINTGGSSNYLTFGERYDGVANGASNPAPFPLPATGGVAASFLTDGVKGLDIGTGIANVPVGPVRFNFSSQGVTSSAINDGIPDVLVTQIAQPSASSLDKIYFVNAAGLTVGSQLTINHDAIDPVGNWSADFYNFNGTIGITNSDRPLRLWAADLSSFGITAENVNTAVALIYEMGGNSDVAFVAFNVPSISVATQLGITTQPSTNTVPSCCNNTGSSALNTQPTVQIRDGAGNAIAQSGVLVTATITSGPAGYGALTGTTIVTTNAAGQAVFTNLGLPCQEGNYTLTFTAGNLTTAAANIITVAKPVYYPKHSGINNLSSLSNWSTQMDGTGTVPVHFGAGQLFMLNNSSGDMAFTTGADWTIAGQLTVPSGKTLTITNNTTTTLSCDINNSGTITGASLVLNGSAMQTLGGTNTITNLTIDNASNVTLNNNVNISNTLTMTNGKLIIGNNNVIANTATAGNANSYVQTNGTGKLRLNVANLASLKFPVGNTYYDPVTVSNNSGAADNFSIRVLDDVYESGLTGLLKSILRIKSTWDITKTNPNAGAGVNLTFQWQSAQNAGMITPALHNFIATAWLKQTNIGSLLNATTYTYPNYTGSFGAFVIIDNMATLPISWGEFTAIAKNGAVLLQWETLSERNTKNFIIQHSVNNNDWKNIGTVNASGNADRAVQYSFTHTDPVSGMNYYRIVQFDQDNKSTMSSIRKLSFSIEETALVVMGNPVKNNVIKFRLSKQSPVMLISQSGNILYNNQLQVGTHQINAGNFAAGMYMLNTPTSTAQIIISR
jgi:hypothetical protein